MNIKHLASLTKKLVSDNSPVILTAIGVTGTITTAVLTARATFKASEVIRENKPFDFNHPGVPGPTPLSNQDKAKLVWKLYLPAATTGVLTCGCIIGANYIGTRRAAALAAAYTLSEQAFGEYRTKVVEKIGPDKEKEIREELADLRRLSGNQEMLFFGERYLCHDAFSGRYFQGNKEVVARAANEIAYVVLHSDWSSLADFYKKIGLEPTSTSEEIGWNAEDMIEIGWSVHEAPDGRPALSFDFIVPPVKNPWLLRH